MTAPCETPGAAPARCSGPSPTRTQDEELLAALERERASPEPAERIAGGRLPPALVTESLQTLIGLLASLFRKERA